MATSEGIFVFTGSAPTVHSGDAINVSGTVTEFIPGGASSNNLSTTELGSLTGITLLSTGNDLPTATVIGAGGRAPPTEVIDSDGLTVFNPDHDGIDFYESFEGMRVTVHAPRAVSGTNSFGEIFTVADNGAGATGLTARGSIISYGSTGDGLDVTNTGPGSDYNPERIQIDAGSFTPGTIPIVDTGAVLNDVTGVVGYSFGNFEVLATSAVTVATPSTLTQETTALAAGVDTLTVADLNVQNLDANDADGDTDVADGRFAAIADQIVHRLGTPDIVSLQEIQDNSGSVDNGVVAANVTLQTLVDAITAAGGPHYTFIDNPFITNDTNGGQPGGNIRVAYLYNADRVSLAAPVSTTPNAATDFAGSRPPLVATFAFNGENVTVIDNHFSSKGGSSPLFGSIQESINGAAAARLTQAQNVASYVSSLGASAKVLVLGDLNEFTNEESLAPLNAAGLNALSLTLPLGERYSYVFEGNAQELDQVFASNALLPVSALDIVHTNSEFADSAGRASDHDPSVVAIHIAQPNHAPVGANDVYAGPALVEDGNSIGTGNVLANDTDADIGVVAGETLSVAAVRAGTEAAGGTLTAVAGATVVNGTYGQLTINADGSYSYALDNARAITQALQQGATGVEHFTYLVADNHGLGDTAQLDLSIAGSYDAGDPLTGTDGRDTLTGTAAGETLKGLGGNDILNGLGGDDVLIGGTGADRLNGGDGNDTASYTDAASGVAASLTSGQGTYGEALGDRYASIENLTGSAFDDVLEGNNLANVIHGGSGNDTIIGRGGADQLFGDGGNDVFLFSGTERFASIDGGAGFDRILAADDGLRLTLGTIANVELISSDGYADAQIVGTAGADLIDLSALTLDGIAAINGLAGNDRIIGSGGADTLLGGGGNDIIDGGGANDIINGGLGVDQLTGGTGADTFVFQRFDSAKTVAAADHILDFTPGQDLIDLSGIDANTVNGSGDDAFDFIEGSAFDGVAGQLRYTVSGGHLNLMGDVNGDGRADFIIVVNNTTSLAFEDIIA